MLYVTLRSAKQDVLMFKENHYEEHLTNCQIGLYGASFCDIVIFIFNGMIIMQTCFQKYLLGSFKNQQI